MCVCVCLTGFSESTNKNRFGIPGRRKPQVRTFHISCYKNSALERGLPRASSKRDEQHISHTGAEWHHRKLPSLFLLVDEGEGHEVLLGSWPASQHASTDYLLTSIIVLSSDILFSFVHWFYFQNTIHEYVFLIVGCSLLFYFNLTQKLESPEKKEP